MKTSLAHVVLPLLAGLLSAQEPAAVPRADGDPQPPLPAGWRWHREPVAVRPDWASRGFSTLTPNGSVTVFRPAERKVIAQHVRTHDPELRGSRAPDYRLVVLGPEGQRVRTGGSWSMSNAVVAQTTCRLRVEDPGEIAKVGVAVLDLDGRRKAAAAGMQKAGKIGARVLPLPVVGEPLDFELPALDGGTVRSRDLGGKVVLIDCWATWCGPCMRKMPELKAVHEKHPDGLFVIGINFDDDPEKAREAIEEHGLVWDQIHASTAAAGEDGLWERITGITTLPRLFLIDRRGVLREDFYPHEGRLEAKVEELLGDAR